MRFLFHILVASGAGHTPLSGQPADAPARPPAPYTRRKLKSTWALLFLASGPAPASAPAPALLPNQRVCPKFVCVVVRPKVLYSYLDVMKSVGGQVGFCTCLDAQKLACYLCQPHFSAISAQFSLA